MCTYGFQSFTYMYGWMHVCMHVFGQELTVSLSLASNSQPFFLILMHSGITGLCYYTWLPTSFKGKVSAG